jgi:hypothetical protein
MVPVGTTNVVPAFMVLIDSSLSDPQKDSTESILLSGFVVVTPKERRKTKLVGN